MAAFSKWLCGAALAAGLVLPAAGLAAPAGGGRQALDDALFTGPLNAANATALPAGHWDIEPYLVDGIQYGTFDDHWHRHNTADSQGFRSVTLLEYGLTRRLTVALLPSFGYNLVSHGPDSQGLRVGDTTLRFQYMLHAFQSGRPWPTAALAYSQVFPSGAYDHLGNHPANGLGGGVYISKFALYTQDYFWMPNGRILRGRLDLSYAVPDDKAQVNGVSVYGTGPSFHGKVDVGDSFSADLAFEYSMTRHWVPAVDLVYSHGSGASLVGTRLDSGLTTPVRSHSANSEAVDIAPALEYNWNEHYGVIVGADVVAAGRNTGATVTPQAALNIYF